MAPKSRTLTLDFKQQLVDYGCYHSKPLNQVRRRGGGGRGGARPKHSAPRGGADPPPPLRPRPQFIHFLFVPLILLSLCVWLALYLPSLPPLPLPSFVPPAVAAAAVPNAALLLILLRYAAYYVRLDPVAGGSWTAAVGLPTWLAATAWAAARPHAAREAAAAHALSWAAQVFIGHAAVEGRRPALVDSLEQSLVLAPLFVWVEALFALGWRPALKADVDAGVAADARARARRRRG